MLDHVVNKLCELSTGPSITNWKAKSVVLPEFCSSPSHVEEILDISPISAKNWRAPSIGNLNKKIFYLNF